MEHRTDMASHMATAGASRVAVLTNAPCPVWSIQGGLGLEPSGHGNYHAQADARFTKTITARWPKEALT
jgi:hypothetical protein